jgi:hypothetical protein
MKRALRYNVLMKSVKIAHRLSLLIALGTLCACRPTSLYFVDPVGPPEYKLGWEDGCDSGVSAQGGIVAKMIYGFKKRPEMSDNDQYKSAWNEGFTYCRFSLDPTGKSTWDN